MTLSALETAPKIPCPYDGCPSKGYVKNSKIILSYNLVNFSLEYDNYNLSDQRESPEIQNSTESRFHYLIILSSIFRYKNLLILFH
jgi:hypothetical protein